SFDSEQAVGLRPVYEEDLMIERQEATEINAPGKILSYGNLLLVNDFNRGIHVVDNSDPSNPQNLFLIKIPLNTDMAVSQNLLYVDNGPDLVGLSVTPTEIKVISRIEGVFLEKVSGQDYPPGNDIYFECVDKSRGAVVSWKEEVIQDPGCYKN
ncbi:MAG: hypothetical protein AAF551_06875, partial [Bacteroidota bacterium]